MDKCPYCGADTRPGDNFCLNCGNHLLAATPSFQQAPLTMGEATLAGSESWVAPTDMGTGTVPATSNQPASSTSIAVESPTTHDDVGTATQATTDKVEHPARFVIRDDKGNVLQEHALDKLETVIGRAPTSDILLSKDKLTSRRHATIRYENGHYMLHDERSANGTFVNGQQLEELTPQILTDGDHVGIGEHELIFRTATSSSVEDYPTVAVQQNMAAQDLTPLTHEDELMTIARGEDFSSRSMNGDTGASPSTQSPDVAAVGAAKDSATSSAGNATPMPQTPVAPSPVEAFSESGVNFGYLTSLPQPPLPDITHLIAALTTLDGQVALLQEQLNATQTAMDSHETQISRTANQLRAGVHSVSERMDSTIADVARQREQAGWSDLLQLMDDVMNNPRDIEYITKLARKARELNKVFQIHQIVLNTLAECNSLLRSLVGDDSHKI